MRLVDEVEGAEDEESAKRQYDAEAPNGDDEMEKEQPSPGHHAGLRPEQALELAVLPDISGGGTHAAPKRSKSQHTAYRADVDGLRAVAVIAVIVYHMNHAWLPGGFVGVDIFFVISGFVVTGSLLAKPYGSVLALFGAFYSRRVRRLTPALMIMVLVAVLSTSFVLTPTEATDLGYYYQTAQLALLGMANMLFVWMGVAYSDLDLNVMRTEFNPFTHTWSLGVEEQFYFVFPFLLTLAYRQRMLEKKKSSPEQEQPGCMRRLPDISARPMTFLSACFAASIYFSLVLSRDPSANPRAFYLMPSRLWQLLAGGMLFLWQERLPQGALLHSQAHSALAAADSAITDSTAPPEDIAAKSRASHWNILLSWNRVTCALAEVVSVSLFWRAFCCTSGEANFPMPNSLPGFFAAVSFIALGSAPRGKYKQCVPAPLITAVVGCSPMSYIGRVSYPLYLWHWPVFVYYRWTAGLDSTSSRVMAMVYTVALACGTYHLLEKRTRRWNPPRLKTVFGTFALLLCLLEGGIGALRGPLYGTFSRVHIYIEPSPTQSLSAQPSLSPPMPSPRPPTVLCSLMPANCAAAVKCAEW